MDLLHLFFSAGVFFLSLAVFANKFRRTHRLDFQLKPNCLLTRWPVVFVTGRRSIFYFSRYWNLYPVFLAEHGYEVFTVHLPWKSSSQRRERIQMFLNEHQKKKYHFVMDTPTVQEFKDILMNHHVAVSVTEVTEAGHATSVPHFKFQNVPMMGHGHAGLLLRFSYWLHLKWVKKEKSPGLNTLGALPDTAIKNSLLLLSRMQALAEADYQEDVLL